MAATTNPPALAAPFDGDLVQVDLPRVALPILVRRLGLAIADGCDEHGVLGMLLRRLAQAATQDGYQTRIECKWCGHTWYEVPAFGLCPVCEGHYLRVEVKGGR